MKKISRFRRVRILYASGMFLMLSSGGCVAFFEQELEALLAPGSPDNVLLVLHSTFFDLLAPLIYG